MPPKDDKPHQIFISADGGETFSPLGRLSEQHLFVDDLVPEQGTELPFAKPNDLNNEIVFSCKFNIRDNPSLFMFIATGKWPSNNWLKLHGYPMKRKGRKTHGQ